MKQLEQYIKWQAQEIIKSFKECLENEKSEELINEWNKLHDRAIEIIAEVKKIDLDFAKRFNM
jgi:flagellin-specific chaperone FliS